MDRELLRSPHKPKRLPPEYQELLAWKCAHQIFEDTARQFPDALAIISGDRRYTYGEVDALSSRIARHIVALGLPVETLIGVYADHSPELLIVFVGILKAGCAYVPIDPQHPLERLKYMLEEMTTPLVLTLSNEHPFGEVAGTSFEVIGPLLEREPAAVADYPRTVKPENLAYVIFTSGSTGRPKGVLLEHKGLVNFCYYYKHFHSYQIGERCAQMVRPGFDASMSEMAGFFFNGVAVCIPQSAVMSNPSRLVDFIVENKVTRGFAATPLGELLIEEDWPETNLAMIELQMGGESLRKRPTKRHKFFITNVYGPTENTNISTEYAVEPAEIDTRPIPIGYAVANTETLILTEDLKPVKPGEAGELFLGGVQLARGYLNRPDLTCEKFIPHPFDQTPGARLYRSGDLARFREDGAVECLGRLDFQVKIRGYRVELGEIENVLNARPGVKQAVVVPLKVDGKVEALAAYWVQDPSIQTDSKTLSADLSTALPEAMVPAHFVRMDVLPLSPNGKIDRNSLPPVPKMIAVSSDERRAETTQPRNGTEKQLLAIWSSVLPTGKFGVRDNFIDIGGTSLTALRIVSLIRRQMQHDIPLGLIFSSATIEKLAAGMSEPKSGATPAGCLIQIQTGKPGRTPLFGIHGFGGHIFQFYLLAKYLGPDVPLYALRSSGLEPGEEADDSFEKMAARYLTEILPVAKEKPIHFAGYSLGGTVAFEAAHQLRAKNHAVGMVALIDTMGPNYPTRLPFKERLGIHLHTVLGASWREKKKYVGKRINNVSERVHFLFGKTYIHPEERRGTEEIIPDKVFWAHRNAGGKYAYKKFPGEITLLKAMQLPDWPGNNFDDPSMGWSPLAGVLSAHAISGSHWTMIQEPNIQQIAEVLKSGMAKAERDR